MLPIACLTCSNILGIRKEFNFLCKLCSSQLKYKAYTYSFGLSLYDYHSVIRKLILSVKLELSPLHLLAVKKIFLSSLDLNLLMKKNFFAVCPSPSSLESRLKGGFDLAWFLAYFISKKFKVKLISPPKKKYYYKEKRSKVENRETPELRLFKGNKEDKILLVDDVLTSGNTITKLHKSFPDFSCYFITLADAWLTRR